MNPMLSNVGSAGKPNLSAHLPQFAHQNSSTPHVFENNSRRSSSTSNTLAAPRNKQSLKKQHRSGKRPQLATEDVMAESASTLRNPNGRRGQSITHLMSFALPPRPEQYNTRINRRRNITYGLGSGHHAVDKARFIHANYRFIVVPFRDYRQQSLDADASLEWNSVLQILASAESQSSACPICLSPPVAPRMAKCGHIFCLPCLIRYMHSTDETNPLPEKKSRYKTCPICWDTIYLSEARPVRWYIGQEGPAPKEGEDIVLRLVMRQPGSTLALPRDSAYSPVTDDIPWFFAADVTDYARVMKGSEDYMQQQYDLEIEALKQQEIEDELMFGDEPEWTRKAVKVVNEAKTRIVGIGNPSNSHIPPPAADSKSKREKIILNNPEDAPDMYHILHAQKSGISSPSGSWTPLIAEHQPAIDIDRAQSARINQQSHPIIAPIHRHSGHHPETPYYFYQALLQYYLAPLDIRILKAAFGTFSSFPSTILPRVEHVSTGHIVDDDLRKRTKYLSHLPHGCEVGFLECDWTDVVPPAILQNFQLEIDRRRKRNVEKETREEKDRVRAEREEEDKRWAAARRRRPSDIPPLPEENFSSNDFQPISSSQDAVSSSPPWGHRQGASFTTLATPSSSPSHPRTVWGTALVAPPSPGIVPQQAPMENQEDGWLQDWEKELMEENQLISDLQTASISGESSHKVASVTQAGGKKKKSKKITLMSTTARRAA